MFIWVLYLFSQWDWLKAYQFCLCVLKKMTRFHWSFLLFSAFILFIFTLIFIISSFLAQVLVRSFSSPWFLKVEGYVIDFRSFYFFKLHFQLHFNYYYFHCVLKFWLCMFYLVLNYLFISLVLLWPVGFFKECVV